MLMIGLACSGRPAPPGPESPVYVWEVDGEPTHWRYVPLSPRLREHPRPEDFSHSAVRCEGDAACLADLGFYRSECSDGRDNDGDGLTDHPADPGCAGAHAREEAPACDDGKDNDRDGHADWDGAGFSHPDPECIDAPSRDREHPRRSGWPGLPF